MGRPKKVLTAVQSGDERETLIALRNSIARRHRRHASRGATWTALSKRLMPQIVRTGSQNPAESGRKRAESRAGGARRG